MEDLLKRAGARPVREINSFSFGEAIKLEVKILIQNSQRLTLKKKQLVDSSYCTQDKEDYILHLLRLANQHL